MILVLRMSRSMCFDFSILICLITRQELPRPKGSRQRPIHFEDVLLERRLPGARG